MQKKVNKRLCFKNKKVNNKVDNVRHKELYEGHFHAPTFWYNGRTFCFYSFSLIEAEFKTAQLKNYIKRYSIVKYISPGYFSEYSCLNWKFCMGHKYALKYPAYKKEKLFI